MYIWIVAEGSIEQRRNTSKNYRNLGSADLSTSYHTGATKMATKEVVYRPETDLQRASETSMLGALRGKEIRWETSAMLVVEKPMWWKTWTIHTNRWIPKHEIKKKRAHVLPMRPGLIGHKPPSKPPGLYEENRSRCLAFLTLLVLPRTMV